ncbi:MAG: 3-phosphoshikimate 1-carboxyvinyltransferase, partial [Coriobacteriales bacterium]
MPLQGSIRVPSDKSISHRAVLFSALAEGRSQLRDLLPSDDVLSSLAAVEQLGAVVERSQGANGIDAAITGFGGQPVRGQQLRLDCGNSGTTTRLLMGLVCGLGVDTVLFGDESLSSRPMGRVIEPLSAMGARIEAQGGTLPAHVLPAQAPLSAAHYDSPKASAQVKSAVLLAGLQAGGTTSVTEPAKSRDHTERLLPAFGVPVEVDGLTVSVTGPARLHAHDMSAPGDPSSAAFLAVIAAVLEDSELTIENVALNPTRTGAFAVLERMGADISYANERLEGAEPVGDVHVAFGPQLVGTVVTPEEIPTLVDEVPVLAIAAAAAQGETVFQG